MMRKLLYSFLLFILSKFSSKRTFSPSLGLLCVGMFFVFSPGFSQSAYITQRGNSSTNQTSNTSLTINKPAGVVIGDVMLVNIAQIGSGNLSNPTSAGWTLIAGANLGTNDRWGAVLYKIATASEPASYTFTLNSNITGGVGSIVAFTGVDVSGPNPFDVTSPTIQATNNTTVNATQITTVTNNTAIIMFGQVANSSPSWNDNAWQTANSPGTLSELYDDRKTTGGNVSVGAAWAIKTNTGSTGAGRATLSSSQRNGGVLVALKPYTYKSQIIGVNTGSTNWCPGETRNVSVTIKNTGTAAWSDGQSRDFNIGIKWNTNGTSWTDYNVRVDAENLTPGDTKTYNFSITASNNAGSYGTPLVAGTNNLTFDVVYEAVAWYGNNNNGVGSGNSVYTTPNQTILGSPAINKTISTTASTICSGTGTNITVAAAELGVSYQLRNSSNVNIGTPVVGTGGNISLPTGNLTATTTFNVLATSCGNSVQMTGTSTITVNPLPTVSNAGPDQNGNTTFTLAANTPTVGTGVWTIASGPSTSLSQFSSTSSPTATFTPFGTGTYVLNWTISNSCGTSTDQVALVTNCVTNLIKNGDFKNGTADWSVATAGGWKTEVLTEGVYFGNGGNDNTAELDSEASLRQQVTVIPGVQYTLNFLYTRRPSSPTNVAVDVRVLGGATTPSVNYTTNNNTSTPFIGTLTFTPTTSTIYIEFYNSLGTTTLGSIIDNIVLVPSSQVTPMATTVPKGPFKTLTACAGVPVQLDVENVPASGVTYSWSSTSLGAVFSSTTIKNPTVTFSATATGAQEATVIVTSTGGCAGTPSSTYVNLIAAPTVYNVTGGGSYCFGGTGLAVGLANSTLGVSYQLKLGGVDNGAAVLGTGGAINFGTKTAAGTYTVVATNPSPNGCALNMNGNAVITVNPTSVGGSVTGGTAVCTGTNSTLLTLSGHTGSVTRWESSLNNFATAGTPIANTTTTYTATNLTATTSYRAVLTSGVCSAATSSSTTITVNPAPTAPTITKNSDFTCGSSGSVTLTNLPSGNWTINQTGTASQTITGTGSSHNITGLAAGNYNFTVTNASNCTSSPVAAVNIINQTSTTTWNGSGWSNGTPDGNKSVIIASASGNPFPTDIVACSLTISVSNGAADPFVTVPKGITLTITNQVISNGKLVFESGASLIQKTNIQNTGDIVYKRETSIRRYDLTYWSMPVTKTGFKMNQFSAGTLYDKFFYWDAVNAKWQTSLYGNMDMEVGKGYSIRGPQSFDTTTPSTFTGVFTGVPNNGDINVAVTANKWNFIGNPYPSAIDAEDLIFNNNLGAVYLWTHNLLPALASGSSTYYYASDDYAVINGTGQVEGPQVGGPFQGYIAAGQAFIAKPTTSTVNFNNNLRVGGNNTQFYKTAKTNTREKNRLWLTLTNTQGAYKQALLGYIEGATNNVDYNFDAATISGNSFIDFYTVNGTSKLSIQGRGLPFDSSDLVPVGYKSTIAGDFTIAIDHADGFFDTQAVYLEDKTTGKITDLRKENYTFKTAIGTFTDRFVLRYTSKTLGTDDFENLESSILVSVKNGIVQITSSKELLKEVNVFNIGAQLLYTKNNVNSSEMQISSLHSSDQALLVKITLENGSTFTKKIIYSNL
ncbi:T9SS sorting signal type C domain-containing protein [Flavobacterium sp. SORGH_AS_0622]|uniref:T9SS sorting signal type C domain-containing protein n=1 Tax=Flavobacterium sp. SORGH_AS_0622 TaxID=3041772 RepID=UPI002789CDA6|nr:T9SS sorting signal type C domain-containing protein [Flavobacterium sp. SORGH_AS_0622]MDQ1167893.1 hypothetical protein [Flavobacterium sp. SORGH_AS_0622]